MLAARALQRLPAPVRAAARVLLFLLLLSKFLRHFVARGFLTHITPDSARVAVQPLGRK